jgi:hypothetical protein
MSGAYGHYELGSIETYWDTWQTLVSAFLLHGKKDESHWKFAGKMANHILMRLPTSANPGFISPLEALTNETPDLSDFIVPFSRRRTSPKRSPAPFPPTHAKVSSVAIAGCRITPVLGFWTCRDLHWAKFTF